jgi:hypothetical protein
MNLLKETFYIHKFLQKEAQMIVNTEEVQYTYIEELCQDIINSLKGKRRGWICQQNRPYLKI